MLDTARMKNIDGRWETNVGDTLDLAGLRQGQVSLASDKIEFGNTHPAEKLAGRGCRHF